MVCRSFALARQPGYRGRRITGRGRIGRRAMREVIAALQAIVVEEQRWGFWKCHDRLRRTGLWLEPQADLAGVLPAAAESAAANQAAGAATRAPAAAGGAADECGLGARFHARHALQRPVFRTLNVIDEANRGALGIDVAVSIPAARVIDVPGAADRPAWPAAGDPLRQRPGAHEPSVHRLVQGAGHRAALHPARQARSERLHRALQPDLSRGSADAYLFDSLDEVREITADWLERYNEIRPHDALGSLPPARYREQLLAAETPV